MRLGSALRQLPSLWERLAEAPGAEAAAAEEEDGRVLARSRLEVATEALGGGVPADQMLFHLRLARGPDAPLVDASAKELRAAAVRVVEETQPFAFELLSQSTLLQPGEQARARRRDKRCCRRR